MKSWKACVRTWEKRNETNGQTKIMDSITEVGQRKLVTSSTNSQKRQSNENGLSEVWVLALFKKLQAIYLTKWTSALEGIEETAMVEWSQALRGLTGEQIKNGLDCLSDEWPPSVIGFRALCEGKAINGFGIDYVPECYRETKRERLIESDGNKAKHKKAYSAGMTGIKDILKRG